MYNTSKERTGFFFSFLAEVSFLGIGDKKYLESVGRENLCNVSPTFSGLGKHTVAGLLTS